MVSRSASQLSIALSSSVQDGSLLARNWPAPVRRCVHPYGMAQQKKKKKEKQQPPKQRLDPRTRHTMALARDGVPLPSPQRLDHIQPLKLESGELVFFPAPFAWVLLIDLARDLGKRGENARRRAWKSVAPFNAGKVAENQVASNDALGFLTAAVVLAVAAIESYANEQIDNLAETATLNIGGKEIARDDMARKLNIEDKLKKTVPLAKDSPSIAGNSALWRKFTDLKELRDDLVHLKERGYSNNADAPSAYGRLMRGDGADCATDAATLIYEMEGRKWPNGSGHLVPKP